MNAKTKTPRGTARAKRRATGNFKPVNPAASLAQHPEARFAREGGVVPAAK